MKPSKSTTKPAESPARSDRERSDSDDPKKHSKVPEVGGRKGPDPTRYGDWEKDGRCVDF